MGTLTAGEIISRARDILQDVTPTTWSDATLLRWHSDAQRLVVKSHPEANIVNESLQLAEGVKQTLPAVGFRLALITRNMGTDGATPGDAIRQVRMEDMTAIDPSWATATASSTVQHFMYDPKDPKVVYNYPPQPATNQGYWEILYAAIPAEVSSTGTAIVVDDIHVGEIVDLICWRALNQETEEAAFQKAQGFLNSAAMSMGLDPVTLENMSPEA